MLKPVKILALAIAPFTLFATSALAEAGSQADELKPTTAADDKEITASEKPAAQTANPIDQFELAEVEVVSNTPLGATGLELKRISGNVQSVEDEDIRRHEAISLADFMNRRLQSVNINDTQNNPYQPDISYRGFNASPVLGTPVGISVYQDGVRINEAFGDTVNWDLIPQMAIANMEVQPGSNPLYGLNTLGGALSIRTKSGSSHPGFSAQALGGSFGRQQYQAEYGGSHDQFDWYFAGNIFDDGGWRPYSPTSVNQGFGKIGWEDDKTDLDLSFTFAGNAMQGVGPTQQDYLKQDWQAINTAPDHTRNTLYFVNLKGNHRFNDYLQLSGNAYNRNNDNYTSNSNTSQCDSWQYPANLQTCQSDGNTINSAFFQVSRARQNGTGINLQLTSDYQIARHDNQLVAGGGYNYSDTHFKSAAQTAVFDLTVAGYYMHPTGPLGDTNYGPTVDITGHNRYSNLFATDNFSIFDWLHVNASVNWLQAQVFTRDHYNANAVDPDTGINPWLGNAVHFQRLNPSAGITFNPFDALKIDSPLKELTTYFNDNEGFRAPTTVEMACANPDAPCSLPNGFTSDPDLKPVVSHTLEAGLRGKLADDIRWNLAVYQTINSNDILFLNAPKGSPNLGYFSNVGTTRRQGLEMGLNGASFEKLNWYVSYAYVDATYQSAMQLQNALRPETVKPGNKIPSIPQNTFKVGSEYQFFEGFFFGADLQHVSSQYARGDDQNLAPQIPDYTVVNLNSRYQVTKHVELFAMGRNIFDNHYATFGQLGNNFFTGQATQFHGPAAPAAGYAGVRVKW